MNDVISEYKSGVTPKDKNQREIINKISNTEKLNGTVYATALIDKKGKVIDCYILKTFNEIVDQRVIDAVKSTNFTTPKRKGRIAKTWVSIPIRFNYK